ncbi:synaptonemal complex central element protein 1-like [Hypanus sabinus]|uniref:synaptonemal complex central element protein 1-like n=1 Tax=Hypanus sabinus TaxID=79690 RepID=UPI0028C4FBC7|nr:synaptonemal complex central element protein 1-like [Hypanus sabinus]
MVLNGELSPIKSIPMLVPPPLPLPSHLPPQLPASNGRSARKPAHAERHSRAAGRTPPPARPLAAASDTSSPSPATSGLKARAPGVRRLLPGKMATMEKKMEPEIEEIVKKIKILIEEKQVSDAELKKLQVRQSAMEKDLEELNHEIFSLEATCNKKEVTLKRLQFQYEQGQAQTDRQLKGSSESKQRIEALISQIEDEKLQRRMERKAFEQQLEELIKKRKWTAEFYKPARLQQEICNIENTKQQLLIEEHETKEKLSTLDKELSSLQQQGATSDEMIFLHSKEARLTHQLFEEENKAAKAALQEMTQQHSEIQQPPELSRLEEEWEPGRKIPALAGKDTADTGNDEDDLQQSTK